MEIFRFMSKKEFNKYLKGEELINETEHMGNTNSKGFCFMYCEDYEPEYAYQFLSGIVSTGVCAVFETKKELMGTYGVYATPYGSFFDSFTSDEYCTKEYNKKDFKLIKYCYDFDKKWYQDKEWKWHHEV